MITLVLVVFGLACGSFVNALVWRIHEQEAVTKTKHQVSKKNLEGLSIVNGRSMCPNCRHILAVKDLIPVFSWLALRGKCRYCQQPISIQYPLVEILTAGLFVASYFLWPTNIMGKESLEFVLWLLFTTGFVALAIYDIKWFILPNRIVYPLLFLAVLQVIVLAIFYHGGVSTLLSSVWGALIGGGIFFVLFQVSRGQWIGGGDVKLGAMLGILVGGPFMSILLLFSSSIMGTIYSLPFLLTGSLKRDSKIPYGPFLLAAAFITILFGTSIINWLKAQAILPP